MALNFCVASAWSSFLCVDFRSRRVQAVGMGKQLLHSPFCVNRTEILRCAFSTGSSRFMDWPTLS